MIRVLSLVENTADKAGLLGEHGLAMWIEIGDRRVLFDTGQGLALLHNAQELGVELERTDAIVLSHGHYDHTGGLAAALGHAKGAKVYAHPEAFRPRFARDPNGKSRAVGIREADKAAAYNSPVEIIETTQPTQVLKGLFATGAIPRKTEYEHTSGPLFLGEDFRHPDPLTDDQALFIESDQGVVVLLGCAHAGAVNTLEYVKRLTGGKPIHAVIGGMHLRNASQERIDKTLSAIGQMNIHCLRPAHCTGMHAVTETWRRFPDRCETWSVGAEMDFPDGQLCSSAMGQ